MFEITNLKKIGIHKAKWWRIYDHNKIREKGERNIQSEDEKIKLQKERLISGEQKNLDKEDSEGCLEG